MQARSGFAKLPPVKTAAKGWSDIKADPVLVEPVCEGNLLQYKYKGKKRDLLFSNPASQTSRLQITIRIGYNEKPGLSGKYYMQVVQIILV